MRYSCKHTEERHLIPCPALEKVDDDTPAADERLMSIESRLDIMQTWFGDLTDRIGDLTSRMGNIEQFLQTLAKELVEAEAGLHSHDHYYPRRIVVS